MYNRKKKGLNIEALPGEYVALEALPGNSGVELKAVIEKGDNFASSGS